MKVELVGNQAAPVAEQPQSPRARAIEAFNKAAAAQQSPQSQEHPVQNPTNVAPEDLSALNQGQSNGNEVQTSPSAPEAPTETAKEKEQLSSQYAQLARREKALYAKAQARERALSEREARIQAQEAAQQAKDAEYQSKYIPKERLTQDTINVLLESGVTYDQITQMMLTQQTQDPATKLAIQRLETQLRAQEEQRESDRKAMAQAQDAQYQAALKQIKSDAEKLVRQDNTFEAIKATGSVKDVVELIEETFKEDGVVLSVEEACQEVENYLVEKLSEYSRIGKIQQRLKANSSAPSPKQSEQNISQQHQPKPTLTNAVGSSKKLTAKERAILAFNNQLKK